MATLVSQYKFVGDYTDSQGTNNLAAGGSGNSFSNSIFITGGVSLSLNGSGDAEKTSGVTSISTGNSDLSFGGWLYPNSFNANHVILEFGTHSNFNAFQMTITNIGASMSLTIYGIEQKNISYSVPTGVFHWYWIEYTASSKTFQFYVDNVSQGTSSAFGNTVNIINAALIIGRDAAGGNAQNGYFNDWRIYNGVTSPVERQLIFSSVNSSNLLLSDI
jgi:hypothetical protein